MRIGLISILLLSIFNVALADCELDKGPAPELQQYIKELDAELAAIRSENNCKGATPNGLSKIENDILATFNKSSNFSNFTTSFRFWIKMVLKTEVPSPIMRDYRLLQSQTKKVQNSVDIAYKNCNVERINEVLGKQLKLEHMYQSIVGSESSPEKTNEYKQAFENDVIIINKGTLTGNKLIDGLIRSYNQTAFQECVNKGKFSFDISKLSESIGLTQKSFTDGFNDWEAGAALLLGKDTKTEKFANIERRLLQKELSKQGVGAQASQAMLNRLSDSGNVKKGDGFMSFLSAIGDRIQTGFGGFQGLKEQLIRDIFDPGKTPNTEELAKKMKQTQDIGVIESEIRNDYTATRALVGEESTTFTTNMGSLVNMHASLTVAIKKVKGMIETSEKICDSQGKGLGICRYR